MWILVRKEQRAKERRGGVLLRFIGVDGGGGGRLENNTKDTQNLNRGFKLLRASLHGVYA